jgi:hypothetical protein
MRSIFKTATLLFFLLSSSLALAEEAEPELTEEQFAEAEAFIVHNALHVLFHEAGHMLISELRLPVLGREEDAVDNLSSMIMLEEPEGAFDVAIQDATDGWLLLDQYGGDEVADLDLMDTHGLDAQRAFNTVCMMTGADPDFFAEFADSVDFPEERREECAYEYEQMRDSWQMLLEPHLIEEGKPASKFDITYMEPDADSEIFAEILRGNELLELVFAAIGGEIQLKDGISLTAKNCGEPNAFWDPYQREITYCYELAELHADVIARYLLENPDE